MKILLSLLVKKFNEDWWEVHTATGSAPDEVKSGHFGFPILMDFIKSQIRKVVNGHEKHP